MIADKHSDPCAIDDCKFCHDGHCWFGMRGIGCPYINPEIGRKLGIVAKVEVDLTISMYEKDPYNAERRDQVDVPIIDSLIRSTMDKAAMITGKTYTFVFKGHEYTHRDNSMDYGSCPHCGNDSVHYSIGYYSSGADRISCFECANCAKQFYYHDPALKLTGANKK